MLLIEDKVSKFINTLIGRVIGELGITDGSYHYDSSDVEYFASCHTTDDYPDFNYGASKLVFISPYTSHVVKIPFLGYLGYDEKYDEELDDHSYTNEHWIEFEYAESEYYNDYCEAEVIKYNRAVDAGFGDFLAKTEFVDFTIDHHPIYIQEKVNMTTNRLPSHDSLEYLHNHRSDRITSNEKWDARAIDWYGLDRVKAFVKYCEENDRDILTDLHGNNIGYTADGRPVIFDYSGFADADYM